jgi:hypothetical protein
VAIYNDAGGAPDTGTGGSPARAIMLAQGLSTGAPSQVDLQTNVVLNSGTYWMVVSSYVGTETISVAGTDGNAQSSEVSSNYLVGDAFFQCSNYGTSWTEIGAGGGAGPTMRLSIKATPEPSSLALMGLGAGSFLVAGWRRRKRKAAAGDPSEDKASL